MFDSIKSSLSDATDSVTQFADRNSLALAYGGICAAIAIPAGIVAVKTTSTAVAVVGGFFAVSYGVGALGSAVVILATELSRDEPAPKRPNFTTVDGEATRVA